MNNKGFTLTELIVVMVLIGIISLIAFPAIDKLQTQNQKEIYYEYEKVLKVGAKLYVDQYSRDLWSQGENGCRSISYQVLRDNNLVKEFTGKKNAVVDYSKTFINATKTGTSVVYKVNLVIKANNNTIYSTSGNLSKCS